MTHFSLTGYSIRTDREFSLNLCLVIMFANEHFHRKSSLHTGQWTVNRILSENNHILGLLRSNFAEKFRACAVLFV